MFENSVIFNKFSAGSDIDAVENRVKHLESMIRAVDARRKAARANHIDDGSMTERVSFKSYLDQPAPPKVQPMTASMQERFQNAQPLVAKYAAQYGVDTQLVNAVIRQESGFNPNAVSHSGARGLMQLMPGTARSMGVQNSFDPEQNVAGGVKLLSGLLRKYNGNVALSLAAYNAGSGAVDRHGGIPPYQETQNYVRRILAAYLNAKSNNA